VHVTPAGSQPIGQLNPAVVWALAEIGIDISREFPRPLTAGKVQAADVVKGRQVRAGDQGVPQGADSGHPGQMPVSESMRSAAGLSHG
jgi:hypothetical protein